MPSQATAVQPAEDAGSRGCYLCIQPTRLKRSLGREEADVTIGSAVAEVVPADFLEARPIGWSCRSLFVFP